ncbi:gamma-type small acid-soluble spore protein [Rummeliibacillus pycnus]|uniref:gamma-type small acid-soluble spore protein n=1 Tax=Rummeliibacillus pycnus TaxID=101070 RepID=UPI0037C63806
MSNYKRDGFTVAGTDIDEVKRKNAESGMSYNEVKAMLAKTNLQDTAIYSDTNAPKIQTENKLKM